MDINYFMKIQNAHGTQNYREKQRIQINNEMEKHFTDTWGTEDVLLNEKPFQLMIQKDTDGNTFKKKIKSPHNHRFNLGDYVQWNGQMWLITLIDSDDRTWNRGYMYLCSILLRWQNKQGKIIERYGYSEDFTKYSTGITGNNNITIGDNQYGITLPVDNETKNIKRDIRFPIDIEGVEPPDIYVLTNRKILLMDNRSFGRGGVLNWTLSLDLFNEQTDKKITLDNGTSVWICDYHRDSSDDTITPPSSDGDIKIIGDSFLKYGRSKTWYIQSGTTIENMSDLEWEISSDTNLNLSKISRHVKKNTIELKTDDDSLIGESFLLSVKNKNQIFSTMKIIITEGF